MTRKRLVLPVTLVAAATLVAVLLAGYGSPYVVRAEFANASGLRTDFKVTLGGVTVGKVKKVVLGPQDTAIATMEVDEGAAPVGTDAAAAIRPSNLLGEKVVELAPGNLRRPAPTNTLIPLVRTSTPTELDDVINVLDSDTRVALGVFLAEQGNALVGRSGDLAATLQRMPPALRDVGRMLADFAADNHALEELIDRSDRIVAAIAPERRSLGRFVDNAGGAFAALASRRAALGATVRRAPRAVAQLRASLLALRRAARPLAPAARGLRTAAPPLTQTLRELAPFMQAARPALRTVRAVAPSLERLAREGTPVVRRLGPAATRLSVFARAADPVTQTFDAGIPDLLGTMEGWARAIQNRDGVGHVYRLGIGLSAELIHALTKDFISPQRTRAPRRQGVANRLAPRPQVPGQVGNAPVPRLPAVKLPQLERHQPQVSSAPVHKLLDYLLK